MPHSTGWLCIDTKCLLNDAAGMQPTMRCPCCKAAVHESAFNRIEKKTTFVVGESILRWGVATAALDKQHTPATARVEVRDPAWNAGTYECEVRRSSIPCAWRWVAAHCAAVNASSVKHHGALKPGAHQMPLCGAAPASFLPPFSDRTCLSYSMRSWTRHWTSTATCFLAPWAAAASAAPPGSAAST